MLSISKNEFNIIGFLIRQFSNKFTIRNIASKLGISSAGAHAALKKLEKNRVVKAERLGTGLFYEVDLNNKIGNYLASISLLDHFDIKKIDFEDLKKESKAIVFNGKQLLVITNDKDAAKDICYVNFKEIKVVCRGEDELIETLFAKNKDVLEILEQGNVIFGEELIINSIKKVMR